MDIRGFLQQIEVLSSFTSDALDRLAASASIEEYSTNQTILKMGQNVDRIGIVVNGKVEIDLTPDIPGDEAIIKALGVFGEMSLLTGEPAMANVISLEPSRIVRVPHNALTEELGSNPLAGRQIAKLLTSRLVRRVDDPGYAARLSHARAEGKRRDGNAEIMSKPILVLNCGSSSIKYSLFVETVEKASGLIERIGQNDALLKHDGPHSRHTEQLGHIDHESGLAKVFELLTHPEHGALERIESLGAVGHRVVHGGTQFTQATIVTPHVKKELKKISPLAPLHNPVNMQGIEICEKKLPVGVPQVCVFDTSFHMTMPEHAYRYALPTSFADEHNLRRFGFHGTSHKYVSRTASAFLGDPAGPYKMITCHLGNGASLAAVDHGRCLDTSMGLTPLEGLVMGTRSGDIDPGLLIHLLEKGMDKDGIDKLLNKQSGLLGLSGLSSDMRELEEAADKGHPGALMAIQVFCYRVRKYIGSYAAAMGGLDAIVFTGGIGENGAGIRSRICSGLDFLNIRLDEERNLRGIAKGERSTKVSIDDSKVAVLVIPTDEEGMIAADASRALRRAGVASILESRKDRPVPVGVSAHHLHLSQEHVEILFGKGHQLTPYKELRQPSQFACEERVDLIGPKGTVKRVRVLGPTRSKTQVEISRTEEFQLGIDAPIRASGDLSGSQGLTLVGPAGRLELKEGVICALRHIHMSPEDALSYGLKDKDLVRVKLEGARSLIFGDVLVRINPSYLLEMHIDTDEANAAEINTGTSAVIESIQHRAQH